MGVRIVPPQAKRIGTGGLPAIGRASVACKFLTTLAAFSILCAPGRCQQAGGDPGNIAGIRAGAAKADITPPLGVPYNLGFKEIAESIGHRIFARVVVLDCPANGERAVLIATDWEGVLRSAHDQVRNAVSKRCSVPPGRVVVNASHSHNSMWINLDVEDLLSQHGCHLVDREYFDRSVEAVADAAEKALKQCRRVRVSAGTGELPEMAINRRVRYVKPADHERFNKRRRYPIGVTDPTLGLVRLNDFEGRPVAVLHVFASHATVYAPNGVISGSYPGVAMRQVEEDLGDCSVALFFQGCGGNISPGNFWPGRSLEQVEAAGRLFANRSLKTLAMSLKPVDAAAFQFRRLKVKLPLVPLKEFGSLEKLQAEFDRKLADYRQADESGRTRSRATAIAALGDRLTLAKNLDSWSECEVQALVCGPLCMVFLPGESFVDFALEIRERSPFPITLVSAYNDCTPVYIPDPIAFEEGGYEVGSWCYSTPQTGQVLVDAAVKLLHEMKPKEKE